MRENRSFICYAILKDQRYIVRFLSQGCLHYLLGNYVTYFLTLYKRFDTQASVVSADITSCVFTPTNENLSVKCQINRTLL